MRICNRIFFLMLLPAFIFIIGCTSSGKSSRSNAEIIAPAVSSTTPADKAVNVATNRKITATFTEEMDPATISTTTFTLLQGATPVSCSVSYVGVTAILSPLSDLVINTTYTATITTGAADMSGTGLAVNKTWSFTTGTTQDTTAPSVSSTIPVTSATKVFINSHISATFSEAMDPETITSATFTLKKAQDLVAGEVTYAHTVATFKPANDLDPNAVYTATITSGAKDLAGNASAVDMSWSFVTGEASDLTAPAVLSTIPVNAATDSAINTSISATFSEGMYAASITTATFKLMQGTTPVAGDVTFAGNVAIFKPASDLTSATKYTATITTDAKDLADNALAADKTWSFTTGGSADNTAPTVAYTIPVNGDTGAAINRKICATFSEGMNLGSITTATFTLKQGSTHVAGTVTYAGTVATFNPLNNLAANTQYTAKITTGAMDLSNNALALEYTWSFMTGTATAQGPSPVNLGTAGNFVILSKSGIATVPSSVVTGDIGVSPIDSTGITGFSLTLDSTTTFSTSSQIIGRAYAADYSSPTSSNLTTAVLNMETAYTDAAGRTLPDFTELGAGNISGLTLAPGLYKWGTGVLITTDVTFDGGPNDVWILQIAGGLTITEGVKIHLTGGALPKNIFWQTFGAVTILSNAKFEGIVLSQTEIALGTGAVVNGRLLSQTAVTLDKNTVKQPAM